MKSLKDITPFGVFTRGLKRREGENSETMAKNLGVTRSFLAQIELGIYPVPINIIGEINNNYYLSKDERLKLLDSVLKTNKKSQKLTLDKLLEEDKYKILNYAYRLMLRLEEVN
jgi:transcriptional regulator with XRE-family HTH domain